MSEQPRPVPAAFDALLTAHDVAEVCGISVREVYRKARYGELPRPIKLGHRTTRWRASEIRAYLENLPPRW